LLVGRENFPRLRHGVEVIEVIVIFSARCRDGDSLLVLCHWVWVGGKCSVHCEYTLQEFLEKVNRYFKKSADCFVATSSDTSSDFAMVACVNATTNVGINNAQESYAIGQLHWLAKHSC